MAELKTQKTEASVAEFLEGIEPEGKRDDAKAIDQLFARLIGESAAMWGPAIVGYGQHRLKYESGREMDWMVAGFSPRKDSFSLYLPGGLERLEPLLAKLGKYKTGKGCLYVKRLSDVDPAIFEEIVRSAISTI